MNYLHPPDDCIDPLRAGLHGRLQVVGGEGDVTHASVALQRIRDVLVTLCRIKIKIKNFSFLILPDQNLQTDAIPIKENSAQPCIDLESLCK